MPDPGTHAFSKRVMRALAGRGETSRIAALRAANLVFGMSSRLAGGKLCSRIF